MNSKKVLFLNLPYIFKISRTSRWPEKTKSGTLYYPYWLAMAAGYCKKYGYSVNLVDCIAKNYNIKDVISFVKDFIPDVIVTEITTPTCYYDFNTINEIHKTFPGVKIYVGGTHATALPETVLNECRGIDLILRNEYEYTLLEILSGKSLNEIMGITYRESESIVKNEDRLDLNDLDQIPFVSEVYKEFLDFKDYFYAFAKHPMIQIFSSRGCPHKCNFCSYPQTMIGHSFRGRSVKNFVDELEYIKSSLPEIQEIFIEDDTFTVDIRRVNEICDEIIQRKLNITWSCNSRVNVPFETMQKMKLSGCRLLVVGFESGNQNVLNETKKGITLEQSKQFASNAKKLKIKVFGCFMLGLKGDNLESIEQTFNFAKKLYPDMVFFQQVVPFPNTEFYQWAKENKYLSTEDYSKWLNENGYLNCLINYPYASSEEIEKLRDKLMSRYYFSFTYIFKTFLTNLSWQEFKRVTRAGFTYIIFRIKKTRVFKGIRNG